MLVLFKIALFKITKTAFQTYKNCSCVENGDGQAESGPCTTKHCTAILAVFVVIAGLGIMFFLTLCQAPVYVVLLRMLQDNDKSLGIGLMSFLSRILGKLSEKLPVSACLIVRCHFCLGVL